MITIKDYDKIKEELQETFLNLMFAFELHGDDGYCVSNIEEALYYHNGSINKLEELNRE